MKKRLSVVLFLVCFSSVGHCLDVPKLTDYVTDQTGTLSVNQKADLKQVLVSHEKETSSQVVVLMIPDLDGEGIEDFANRTFHNNGIGQKGKDNGILIVVAKNDRKMRIEVGYGLEANLTSGVCSRIIREEMVPRFRQDDFSGGLKGAVGKITLAIKGAYDAGEGASENGGGLTDQGKAQAMAIAFVIVAFVLFCLMAMFSSLHWLVGAIFGAISCSVATHLFFASPGWTISAGIIGFVLGLLLGLKSSNGESVASSVFKGLGDVASSSSYSGGGRSSGSGSPFSGGGGDSGGGGSSGSW